MLNKKYIKKNIIFFLCIGVSIIIIILFLLKYCNASIYENFDQINCLNVNSVANQPTSKAMIANEIITSLNNHEKFFSIYGAIDCNPNVFNMDGTIQKNDKPCESACSKTTQSCARYVCNRYHCDEWEFVTENESKHRDPKYTTRASNDEYLEHNSFGDTLTAAAKGHLELFTHKTCKKINSIVCDEYDKVKCDLVEYKNECESLRNFSITGDDLSKMKESGYSYFNFANNVIPYIANHDLIIKKMVPSYAYYDTGSYDTASLLKEDPNNINYNKLSSKFHNGLKNYNVSDCIGSSVSNASTDNDGYVLWILVDWLRYQDYVINSYITNSVENNPIVKSM